VDVVVDQEVELIFLLRSTRANLLIYTGYGYQYWLNNVMDSPYPLLTPSVAVETNSSTNPVFGKGILL
jgi:hypothetical protein